jgi:hypothetical protein
MNPGCTKPSTLADSFLKHIAMQKFNLLIIVFACLSSKVSAQFFEGEIEMKNYFLDKVSYKPLMDPQLEIVTVKGYLYKSYLPNAESGSLEWQIDNFAEGVSYSRISNKNSGGKLLNINEVKTKDSIGVFGKVGSDYVQPIMKGRLCVGVVDSMDVFLELDTVIMVSGFKCKVLVRNRKGERMSEYYYTDSIRMDPSQYSCLRADKLDKVYKKTGGALIVQLVEFDKMFIGIQQIQRIERKKIEKSDFFLPEGIRIEEYK